MAKNHSQHYPLNIFEKETTKLIRSFFYKKQRRRIRIYIATLIIPMIILGSSRLVKADLFYFYSPLCLGSWTYVKNVEGEPQVSHGGNIADFDNSNSAILKNSGGQIFCGRFESPNPPDGNIRGLTLRLSLAVQHERLPEYLPQDLNNGNILDSEADQSGTFIIDTDDLLQNAIEENIEPQKEETDAEATPELIPKSTLSSDPIPSSTPEQTPQPSPEATAGTAEPAPTPEEIKSEEPISFWNKVFNIAHAQENTPEKPLNLDDLASVQYTLDSENWVELGRITASNWNDLSFKIPINSLDQISQLQISLASLPTAGTATIYLDSVWLEAETDSAAIELASNILETILETITLQNLTPDTTEATPSPEPNKKEPRLVKIKEYNFDIGSSEKADDELEWYPRENIQKLEKFSADKKDRNIEVDIKSDSKSLVISGSCKDEYYVVLLYRDKNDYAQNPSSAVYNSALECEGRINHQLVTDNLADGNYYLLVGEQGKTGSWMPISDLKKISVEIKEKEIEQEQ